MADSRGTFESHGVNVQYKTRTSKKDRRHLIVMFSGIRPKRDYDLDGSAMSSSQASWLWIRDDFDDEHAYYMCRSMDFSIENAVIALIEQRLEELNLSKDQCTLIGFSKGGSAALYFGLKYNFTNIVATVPQILIGSYNRDTRPHILAHMTRNGAEEDVAVLDSLIPGLIAADRYINRNIYIWSSRADEEFASQIEPFLDSFKKYSNFNVILSNSKLVDAHIEVTRYNIPTIMAVLAFVVDGIAPSYGSVVNGGEAVTARHGVGPELREARYGTDVVELHGATISNGRWFPKGVAFRKGSAVSSHGAIKRSLILKSQTHSRGYVVGSTKNKWNSSAYYDSTYRDYSFAGYATMNHAGIPLDEIEDGVYDVSMLIDARGTESVSLVVAPSEISSVAAFGSKLVRVVANPSGTVLEKRPLVGRSAPAVDFSVTRSWARGELFHVEGRFVVEGLEADHWSKIRYFLALSSAENQYSFDLGCGKRMDQIGLFDAALADYSAAYYATPGYAGLSASDISDGEYRVMISLVRGAFTYSENTQFTLKVNEGSVVIVRNS